MEIDKRNIDILKSLDSKDIEGFKRVGIDKTLVKREDIVLKKRKRSVLTYLPYIYFLLIVFLCIGANYICNKDPSEFYLSNLNEAPSREFLFGTDSLGRDIFSMIFYGGRKSILIGFVSMFIISIVGIFYGSISAMSSERIDNFMMRFAELWGSIPGILRVLILSLIIGNQNEIKIALVIGLSSWFGLARIVRAEVGFIRNTDYIIASKRMGSSFIYIMRRHLIPNFLPEILFPIVSSIALSMSMESTLSFLGLGLPIDVISWGSMLSLANKALLLNTWWVIIIPGFFLVSTLLSISLIAEDLRKEIRRAPGNLA